MALTAAQLDSIFQNVLFRPAEPAAIAFYANRTDVSDAQIRQQIELSQEATVFTNPVVRLFEAAFNRLPTQADLRFYGQELKAGLTTEQVAGQLAASTEFSTRTGLPTGSPVTAAFVTNLYQDLLNRAPSPAEVTYYTARSAAQVLNGLANSPEATQAQAAAVITFVDSAAVGSPSTGDLDVQAGPGGNTNGTVFTLTASTDSGAAFTGGSNNDTFNAPAGTFTSLDQLNGAGGTDTLNLVANAAFTTPGGVTVSNIENVNAVFTAGGTISTAAGSGFTGVTQLTVQNAGGVVSLTADATTDETVSNVAAAGNSTTVSGGRNVNVTVTGATGSGAAVNVGPTTNNAGVAAPTGAVTVNNGVAITTAGAATGNAISVTGGTVVNISSTATNSAPAATALTDQSTVTLGAVTVTGTTSTTAVTVSQTAAVGARDAAVAVPGSSNAVTGRTGVVDGAVAIADANAGSTTVANTIAAVALGNYGTSTISSTALTNLALSGTGGTLAITTGGSAAQIAANTTLGLALGGGALGVITDTSAQFATVNAALQQNTTLGGITDTALRTLNLSGTGVLTLSAVNTALTAINQTGTVGLNANVSGAVGVTAINATGTTGAQTLTLNAATQSFTGGSGRDVITIGGDALRAITGGSGTTDQLVLSANGATYTANTRTNATGFEQLGINTATPTTAYDLNNFNAGINRIEVIAAPTTSFTNVRASTALQLDAATTSVTYATSDTNGASDSVAVTLQGTGATGSTVGFTTAALALTDANGVGIANVSINSDASVGGGLHQITNLTDAGLSNLAITGTGSLSIGTLATGVTSLTISDNGTGTSGTADGIVALTDNALGNLSYSGSHAFTIGTLTDTVANLTISNANTGTTGVLTVGQASTSTLANLTLNGSVAYTGTNTNTGAVTVNGSTDNAAVNLTVNGLGVHTITLGNGANVIVSGAGLDVITTGTGASTITGAAGADKITFGVHTGIDTINQLTGTTTGGADTGAFAAPAAGTNQISTTTFDVVTGLRAGDHIQLTTGYNGNTGAARGLIADGTTANSVAALPVADNSIEIVRGTYTVGTNTFVGSATGADSLFVYDSAATVGSQSHEAIVLVGYVAQTAAGIGGNTGLVTLA